MFSRILEHLLPNSEAWKRSRFKDEFGNNVDKKLWKFLVGLLGFLPDIKKFIDNIYWDQFPLATRQINEYEDQFGIIGGTQLPEIERRRRLDAEWKAIGGQSPRYIQDTLQGAGFDVYVHEWWELPIVGAPVARNPNLYLTGGDILYYMSNGGADAQNGGQFAQNGGSIGVTGYPLVNIIDKRIQGAIGNGNGLMQNGGQFAQNGGSIDTYYRKEYILPTNPLLFPYFLYIGGVNFPDHAIIPNTRKNEFERLCLKICPNHLWIGILATYN